MERPPPAQVLPAPEPLALLPVEFRVLDIDGAPIFALDADGYEALARNLAEVLRWVTEATAQLDYYRRSLQGAK